MTYEGESGVHVDPPQCEERPYGLLSVAQHDERSDFDWGKGLEFDLLPCTPGRVVAMPVCPALPEHTKEPEAGFDTVLEASFAVYAGWSCSPASAAEDAWDNAEAILRGGWKNAVEAAFWTGEDQDGNTLETSLAGGGAEDLTPIAGALSVVEGVAALESYMATVSRCRPIIHANVGVGAYMSAKNLTNNAGPEGPLRMYSGSLLALGGGYLDTGPGGDDPDPDEAWIYITGPVRVTTSPVFLVPSRGDLAGATDRAKNDATVFAEMLASIGVGCGLAAVRISLTP